MPPKANRLNKLLPHLGNISAQKFLDEYWQKQPLLVRGAFAEKFAPLTKAEIFRLSTYEEAECRLITNIGTRWSLDHGPFLRGTLPALAKDPQAKWTVLIQDTQHFSHEAHALLAHFNFLPQARIDDLMVSYAVKGGGVGPHFDSYDVFLLQGSGKRRWQISSQQDQMLKSGLPLKILRRFQAEQEWVLDEGDMLYLPPSWAHNGIAETNHCVTWSIGFRAPSNQELLEAFLDDLRDGLKVDGRYTDPRRNATDQDTFAAIDAPLQAALGEILRVNLSTAIQPVALNEFIGRYLSQPKSHVTFDPPESDLTLSRFTRRALAKGLCLDLRSRLLYDVRCFYINGELLNIAKTDRAVVKQLANRRMLTPNTLTAAAQSTMAVLHQFWRRGHFQIASN